MIFLILVSCKNKAMSASCPQQKFHSSSRFPSLFLSSLGSFSILFLLAKLGACVALWFALTPPPLKWLTEKKNPFEVCKHAARMEGHSGQKCNLIATCIPLDRIRVPLDRTFLPFDRTSIPFDRTFIPLDRTFLPFDRTSIILSL